MSMHSIEIDGRQVPVTRCPTAYAAPTQGGEIPARERKVLAEHIDRQIAEDDPAAWMRQYPKPAG